MTTFLLFVIVVLLAYQILRDAAKPEVRQRVASDLSSPHHDTTTFRLLAPDGSEEFEVSWHRGEIPADYRHGETYYTRGPRRPDGSVEFQR